MGTIFSETLTRLRREAGFPTAYRFYHENDGAHILKISYRKYLSLEQGSRFPLFGRLRSLLFGLRALSRRQAGNELVIAWIKTMAGDADYNSLLKHLLNPERGAVLFPPAQKAGAHAFFGQKYSVTALQFNAIVESRDNYLCYLALLNDDGKWRQEELAERLKLSSDAASKALEALVRVEILKKDSSGRYKCPLNGKIIVYPHYNTVSPARLGKMNEYLKELMATGVLEWERFGTLRADSDALREFLQIMQLNISTAQSYAITSKTNKSALFAIRGSVTRLRDF